MKNSKKTTIAAAAALLLGAVVLTGCNANFCSVTDQAHIAYPYEQGVTVYCNKADVPADYMSEGLAWQVNPANDNLWAYVPVDTNGDFAALKTTNLNSIISSAEQSGYSTPSQQFFAFIDQKVLDL